MLAELSRREKAANIKPDPDIDVYMKVRSFFEMEAITFWNRINPVTLKDCHGMVYFYLAQKLKKKFDLVNPHSFHHHKP